jgi:hypothetical protein
MSQAPDLADDAPEPVDAEGEGAVEEAETQSDEVSEAEVELTEDDLGGDLFDGLETAEASDEGEEKQAPDPVADGLRGNAAAMEDAINEGAARLSVVGLTENDFEDSDLDKEGLEAEFQETFQAFRLGYFGSRAVEEYFLEPADHEVVPIWGLLGSALIGGAMVIWLRPDGDQAVTGAREAISNMTGGGS